MFLLTMPYLKWWDYLTEGLKMFTPLAIKLLIIFAMVTIIVETFNKHTAGAEEFQVHRLGFLSGGSYSSPNRWHNMFLRASQEALYPRIQMEHTTSPFNMRFDTQHAFFFGARGTFSSQESCYLFSFWGVPVNEFFELMKRNWSSLRTGLLDDGPNSFRNRCIAADPSIRMPARRRGLRVFIPPPDIYIDDRMHEGLYFPLVVFMLSMENPVNDVEAPVVFAQATIVKVPSIDISIQRRLVYRAPNFLDNISRKAEIIATYVTEYNPNRPVEMKLILYGSMNSEDVDADVPICVACYHIVVNTVTFPCFHSCLCSLCYHSFNACPCCGGPTTRFVVLGPELEVI